MRSLIVLAASGGMVASASPVAKLEIKTDTVLEMVTVTVTEPAASHTPVIDGLDLNKNHFDHTVPAVFVVPTATLVPFPVGNVPHVIPQSALETPVIIFNQPVPAPAPTSTSAPAPKAQETPAQQEPAHTQQTKAQANDAKFLDPSKTGFADIAVHHHNVHRFNHSASALTWSDTLAGYADEVARTCVWGHDTSPGNGGYGQNIAMWGTTGDAKALGASTAMAQAATNMWYNDELQLFPQDGYGMKNPNMAMFEGWGHYSQMVWKATTEVGCSSFYCKPGSPMSVDMGTWFTVCNYSPQGNMGGQYGANIAPPEGQASVHA